MRIPYRHLVPPLSAIALVVAACQTGGTPEATAPALDRAAILERHAWRDNRDNQWFMRRIPFFESPDPDIDATYYYRWEVVTKHLTYGSPETGYTLTEFIDRPFWAGAYGAISCPLGHQLYELRWLNDRRIIEDFARYWFEAPGAQPRSYSNWFGDAVWATSLVTGDTSFLRTMLPHMVSQYDGWMRERWDAQHRMFAWDGLHDGMEVNINSKQTADTVDGAPGFRPTLNAYLFADARAISRTAALFGDSAMARDYATRSLALKKRVQDELWDSRREFFLHQAARDEQGGIKRGDLTYESGPFAGNAHGRELIGYVPWQFSLPDSGYEAAWKFLMDTVHFAAPRGPTTAERGDPLFAVSKTCCVWRGNAWPYATSQTLTAMANLLNEYQQEHVTREDYAALLRQYAQAQRKNGTPYIAEAADPFTGSWEGHDTYYHSEHYFHSSYVDLVITGLAGIRPRADDSLEVHPLIPDAWDFMALEDVMYRGRKVSVYWDRDGKRYGRGAGLSLFVNGRRIAQSPTRTRLVAHMGAAPALEPVHRPVNFAVNNGRGAYPMVTASHSAPQAPPHFLIDGHIWYHAAPPNRWTAQGSRNAEDWVELDFGIARPVEELTLYFLEDGDSIRPPASYRVEQWRNGAWQEIAGQQRTPASPEGRKANRIRFAAPLESERLRVVLVHRPGATSGLSEIESWAHAVAPFSVATAPTRNLAFTATAASMSRVAASFTSRYDKLEQATDGQVAYTRYSRNRWSAFGTTNTSDWIAVDLGAPRKVHRIEVHLVADGRGLVAPRRYTVQVWNGTEWIAAQVARQDPAQPQAWAMNTTWLEPTETARVRVVFEHAQPGATAVSELLIFGDGK
jgi:hypothetical protein